MSAETRQAIQDAIKAHIDDEFEQDLPVDWAISVGMIDMEGHHTVGTIFSRDPMPGYIARGLWSEAQFLVDKDMME